jgi:DNA-binding transcriptional ArsR family regulator
MRWEVRDLRDGSWFWVHDRILDEFGPVLGPYGLSVYAALARFADRGQMAHPAQVTIAERVGISRAQVSRELAKLEALGLVRRERRDRYHCLYAILRPPEGAVDSSHQMSHPETQMSPQETQMSQGATPNHIVNQNYEP